MLPKSFGLRSQSHKHYQQPQVHQMLLQPAPPLSLINNLNFTSNKGIHPKNLNDHPLLLTIPALRKAHTVRNEFTFDSQISPITRRKDSSRSVGHASELPTLLSRFLDENLRCSKPQTTRDFELLHTRNLSVGSQSFNHAF